MLNQVILVGRLKDEIEWLDEQNAIFTLAVSRPTKDKNGEYGTDMVKIKIVGQMANNTAEYCHKGDIIGIKGRVVTEDDKINIVAEKATFLSSHKQEDNDEDE